MKSYLPFLLVTIYAIPMPQQMNADGNPIGPVASGTTGGTDQKTSALSIAFKPFDGTPGPLVSTSPCTNDEDCQSRCCDGKSCRSPDALKGAQTCRNGLMPKFEANNAFSFVKAPVSSPDIGAPPKTPLPPGFTPSAPKGGADAKAPGGGMDAKGAASPAGGNTTLTDAPGAAGAPNAPGAPGAAGAAGAPDAKKGEPCGNGKKPCTSAGNLSMGDPKEILADCEKKEKECQSMGKSATECKDKGDACRKKVEVDMDFNAKGPANTFGF